MANWPHLSLATKENGRCSFLGVPSSVVAASYYHCQVHKSTAQPYILPALPAQPYILLVLPAQLS